MKKLTKYILSVLTALVLCFISSNAVYAEVYKPDKSISFRYETHNDYFKTMMAVWDINDVYYMVADLEIASPGGLDDADTSKIFTYEERIDLRLNDRYACVDGILYDLVLHCENDIAITKTQCGTLQGLFNTGRYDCWDTEPVAGALDAKNPFAKPITETITVEDYSATMYATKKANVRSNGSTDYDIIGTVKFNEEVTVTGKCSTGWYRIKYNGGEGFVSNKLLTDTKYVEPEVPVIDNRLFTDLNEEALGVLRALLEDAESEVKIEVLDTAEHKIIPKEILSIMKAVEKGVKVHFVDTNGVISYSYTLNGVNDEKDLNLALTVEETGLNFEAEEVLNYTLSMQIKLPRADGEYFIYIGNIENNVLHDKVRTDADGYITFVTNMQTDYMLTEKEFVKEEPEPEMPEEITPPVENEEEPDEDGVIITPPTEDIPEEEPDNNDTGNEAEQAESEETVLEKDETKDRMKWYILIGSVSLVVIVIVGFAISKGNKKKKNELSKVKDNE